MAGLFALLLFATSLFAVLLWLLLATLVALLLALLAALLLLAVAILFVAVLLHQSLLLYGNIAVAPQRATAKPATAIRVTASGHRVHRPVHGAAAPDPRANLVHEGVELRTCGGIDLRIGQRKRGNGRARRHGLHAVEDATGP